MVQRLLTKDSFLNLFSIASAKDFWVVETWEQAGEGGR